MKFRNIIFLAAAISAAACVSCVSESNREPVAEVYGPDGRLHLEISGDRGSLMYSVEYDGIQVMGDSPLGIVSDIGDFTLLKTVSVASGTGLTEYRLDRIKTSDVSKAYNFITCTCMTPDSLEISIEFRVSDNDIAFRYLIPRQAGRGSVRVIDEKTSFAFPAGTTTFLTPQSDAMIGWMRTKPSYEEYYCFDAPMDELSQYGHGYTFPCLFHVGGDMWVLVSETGVDANYCGSRLGECELKADGTGVYKIEFPMPEENNGNGTVEPAFALPGATPWRTLTVGSGLAPIVETTVPWDYVMPRYASDHEYSYGKGSWSWIIWQDRSINLEDQKKYVDLSAEMNFEFCLVDNWWDRTMGHEGIEELARYARSRGVELLLWYSSSGWWNDISQSPVNIMCDPVARKKEMEWLESVGVSGIKVDFFGGDKQETMRLYDAILSDADDHGLMVIFHGCTIPRGWERMYPNYVGSEAVRASENLVFNQEDCDSEALYACLHPYVRNAIGCMEFGGCVLNKVLSRNNGIPDAEGNVWGTQRRVSDVFEIATAVLFQNPVQNFALAPNNLEDAPAFALDFLREVPTQWDETRWLGGYPGRNVALARRSGNRWWVASACADGGELLDMVPDFAGVALVRHEAPDAIVAVYEAL